MSVATSVDSEFTMNKSNKNPYNLHVEKYDLMITFDWVERVVTADSTIESESMFLMKDDEKIATIDLKKYKTRRSRYEITVMTDNIFLTLEPEEKYVRYLQGFLEEHVDDEHMILDQ